MMPTRDFSSTTMQCNTNTISRRIQNTHVVCLHRCDRWRQPKLGITRKTCFFFVYLSYLLCVCCLFCANAHLYCQCHIIGGLTDRKWKVWHTLIQNTQHTHTVNVEYWLCVSVWVARDHSNTSSHKNPKISRSLSGCHLYIFMCVKRMGKQLTTSHGDTISMHVFYNRRTYVLYICDIYCEISK